VIYDVVGKIPRARAFLVSTHSVLSLSGKLRKETEERQAKCLAVIIYIYTLILLQS
jgi:hypothetical protein